MWLNLDEDAWVDIGIDNKFYMRKMQLIMPQFVRLVLMIYVYLEVNMFVLRRYQKRQERLRRGDEEEEEDEEEDDGINSLLCILHASV